VANIDRQTRELGWSPTISLASGLATTVRWWDSLHARDEIEPALPAVALTTKELSC
jgi:dTDP-D-glucose 4,6-dehydratase